MPIGTSGNPPGFTPERHPGIVDTVILWIGGMIGAVLSGAAAYATSIVRAIANQVNDEYPNAALSPEQCAVGVVKNTRPGADWRGEARLSGVDEERFDAMVGLTGNPPGPETVLDMLNRGIVDESTAEQGLRESYLRPEWVPIMMRLRYGILSGLEVVRAAVQGHLSDGDARARWAASGRDPADYDVAFQTAGRPPGIEQMLHLMHRQLVTAADVEQAIRESDIKDKYIPAVMRLGDYLPPPRTITTLLSHGAIDTGRAHELFMKAGLDEQLATEYVNSALHAKSASHKELAVGQVKSLYSDGVITRAQALGYLAQIGYDAQAGGLVLDLADAAAEQKLRQAAVNRVRALFVAGKINAAQVHADLARAGLDAAAADRLLTYWGIEQSAPFKTLTLGQINAAFKKGLIDRGDFLARARGLGYDLADANLLADIDVPPTTP